MALSFALVFLSCIAAGKLCTKLSLPPLFGYMICGIILGPAVLNVLDSGFLDLSAFLRKCALLIILCRAGFGMDLQTLRKNGLSAGLMCFLPATFEIAAYGAAAFFLHIPVADALVLGCVMGAVSPAVVVPRMLKISKSGYGEKKGVAQVILAGASMDDIYTVTLFSAFLALAKAGEFSWMLLLQIPVSILTGAAAGLACGWLMLKLLERTDVRPTIALLLVLSVAWLLSALEDAGWFPFASLLGVVCMCIVLRKTELLPSLQKGMNDLWTGGEMILFALVGTLVSLNEFMHDGLLITCVMLFALIIRAAGVWISLLPSSYSFKEKLFCILAYLPKATVQAAIGSIPLASGLASGTLILGFAAASILITAPVGAWLIDSTYKKLLVQNG